MFQLLSLVLLLCISGLAKSTQHPILPVVARASSKSFQPSPFSSEDLLDLHKSLVETESITGNELAVGDFLSQYLLDAGLVVEQGEVAPNRNNIFAYRPGHRNTSILVTSHIDTVPPFWPYERRNNGTEIWGRGSVDAKACVASQVIAVLSLLGDERVKGDDVSLLFVVGEEKFGDGMRAFSATEPTNYTAVVFGEPTEGKLASGHKGILGWTIKIKGKAGHSGYPELGLSANEMLLDALDVMRYLVPFFPSSKKYGNSTMNIGRIEGGVAANVIPETAEANIALRIAGGTVSAVKLMVSHALKPLSARVALLGGELALDFSDGYGPVYLDSDIKGFDVITVNYGTDVPNLEGEHKKYLYGPGSILVAHSDHEHLKVSELEQAVVDYQKIILGALSR